METIQLRALAIIGTFSPSLAARLAKGWDDAERGEITVAAVVWAGVVIAIAIAAGAVILTKTKTKASSLDLDQPVQ